LTIAATLTTVYSWKSSLRSEIGTEEIIHVIAISYHITYSIILPTCSNILPTVTYYLQKYITYSNILPTVTYYLQ